MNILYLTQFFSSSRGGGPLVFYDLANKFSDRGNRIHVICNFSNEKIQKDIVVHIVKPYLKESHQLPPSMTQNLLYIFNSVIHGIGIVRKYKIELIHTNAFSSIIAGSILGKLSGLPVISTVHDVFSVNRLASWSEWALTNELPKYYALIGKMFELASLRMPVSMFHAVSKNTEQNIKLIRSNAAVRTIYTGIDTKIYEDQMNKREYHNNILFIGRLVFFKNVGVIIKAFKSVLEAHPDAKLIIVGNGPMKEIWKDMSSRLGIGDSVSFVGNISTEDKIALVRNCAALALPSLHEGFGLVILEAFAMAKPVLVSDVKPFDEIVTDGIDGFVIHRDDYSEWSYKMQGVLQNKSLCKTMGENGMQKVYSIYCLDRSIDQIEQLYQKVLSDHNSGKMSR